MRTLLFLISIQLAINCYGQSYQEADFIGFWQMDKTTINDPIDGEMFPGFNYWPVNFLHFKPDSTLTAVGFSREDENYYLYNTKTYWGFAPQQKSLKMAGLKTLEAYNLIEIAAFKPMKKLILIHPLTIRNALGTEEDHTSLEKNTIYLKVTYKRSSLDEVLNVTKMDDVMTLNREVTNIEWVEFANDLTNKAKIISGSNSSALHKPEKQFDPVFNITHDQAIEFCEWKARQIKDYFDLNVIVRLPTRSEWEKIANSITDGSEYRMKEIFVSPDLDSFYFKKAVKVSKDLIEWCQEEEFVYEFGKGVVPAKAEMEVNTGFRYVIEFL